MSSKNFFLKKELSISKLFPKEKFKINSIIKAVKPLDKAHVGDLTFYDLKKYKDKAIGTKASFCITTKKLINDLPKKTIKIIVNNVLLELCRVTKTIYPHADIDYPDMSLKPFIKAKYKTVKFGNNVLVGKNVKIGKNSIIGSNTIIEQNVEIGEECVIGSGVIIKNSIIDINKEEIMI